MRSTLLSRNPVFRLAIAAAAVLAVDVRAATWVWDEVTGNWSFADNWDLNTVPLSATDTSLVFGGSGPVDYTATFDLTSPFSLNVLTLQSSASLAQTINGAGVLDFRANGGTLPTLTQDGAGAFTLATGIAATDALTLGGTGTGLVTLGGVISGGGGLTFSGGNWRITGTANTFTGGVNVGTGAFLELARDGGGNQNVDFRAGAAMSLGSNSAGPDGNLLTLDGGTLKLTTSGTGSMLVQRALTFGAGGGTLDLRNANPAGPGTHGGHISSGDLTVTLNNTAPAVIKFNGGQLGLSDIASPASGNWSLAGNALRFGLATSGNGPLRVEVTNGALVRTGTAASQTLTIAGSVTYRGVAGGDPTSGITGTVNTALSLNTGRVMSDRSNLTFTAGVTFEDAIQFAVVSGASALDGNITLAGTASGHPAFITFTGRTTGTNINATIHEPVTGSGTGQHVLWLGRGSNDTLSVQDGAIGVFDARSRIDFSAHSGVLLDALGVIQPGGTLRAGQSVSNFSNFIITAGANNGSIANVGDVILRGDIEGQGSTGQESLFEILLPAPAAGGTIANGVPLPLVAGAPAFGSRPFGGLVAEAAHGIIVNGTGFGGLRVVAKARPDGLFSATGLIGGAAIPDPTPNTTKLNAYLTPTRLAAITGSGGYLTPAALGQTWNFPAGGEWAPAVSVGLRVSESNPAGADVSLGALTSFGHNIAVDAGATLDLGSAPFVFSNGTLHGAGTVTAANGITVSLSGSVSPGMDGVGTLSMPRTTLDGTLAADVTASAADLLVIAGDMILGGASALAIQPGSVFAARDYTIATLTGTRTGTFGSVTGLAPTHELDYAIPGTVRLSRIVPVRKWNGTASGIWNTSAANWQAAATYADGDRVILDDTDTGANRTITIPSPVAPGRVTVDTASAYTVVGAITGGAALFKNGVGTLTLTGPHSFTDGIFVSAGTLRIGQDDSLPDTGIVDIAAGATLDLDGFDEQLATLVVAGSVTLGDLAVTDLTLNGATSFAPMVALLGTLTKTGAPLTMPGAVNLVGARTISVAAGTAPELTIAGKITGGGLFKTGGGTLVLANGDNDFTGGTVVSAGTVKASAAGALPTGGNATVAASAALDLGGFAAGLGALENNGATTNVNASLLAGPVSGGGVLDLGTGALTIGQDVDTIYAGPITATGGLVKTGTGRITLTNVNNLGAAAQVDGGTLRLGAVNAAGSSHITVNSGGTLIVTTTHANAITLAGGTLGGNTGTGQNPFTTGDITALAGTTSTVITADPEALATNSEMVATGTLRGAGDIIVLAGPNVGGADFVPGFRLRGAGASDFTGVITVGNRVKFELQTAVAGPFSPMGGGKIIMTAGILIGDRSGAYSQLNLRSNFAGDTILGNDVEITGAGTVNFGPVGSAPLDSKIILGNLKLGAGQIAAVNKNGAPNQTVQFSTVTLTGGDATFAPGQQEYGFANGSDLVLGAISELTPGSGITMSGGNRLTLLGPNTYTGPTTINRGLTVLAGPAALPAGTELTMSGGQLDISDGAGTSHSRTVGSLSGSAGAIINSASDATRDFIVNQDEDTAFAGSFGSGIALVKRGTGSLRLIGSHTFGTAVRIENGTLVIGEAGFPGVLDAPVFIGNGGTLAGDGSTGVVTLAAGGGIAAGYSPGAMTVAGLNLAAGSALAFEINGTIPGVSHDQLNVTGSVALGGDVALELTLGFNPADNVDVFTLILNGTGPFSGGKFVHLGNVLDDHEQFTVTTGALSQLFEIHYAGGDGNDLDLVAIPEPAAATLLLAGLSLAARRRRRTA